MEEKYVVELSREERDYLLSLCATVPDDDAVAQEMLGECGLDALEDALRNAETAQGDALQRLEKWADGGADRRYQITRWGSDWRIEDNSPYLVELDALGADAFYYGGGKSIADAISDALEDAEGADHE